MAKSESHTLGEFIGTFFEDLMKKPVMEFAKKNNLYFDTYGERTARPSKKLTWTDVNGSKHDLDFVLEKDGTDETIGTPVAFIELAWRRYTKHSKNKVQEISGALNPICKQYDLIKPFKGAILCGHFTDNALEQLEKDGFSVLYIPFDKLVEAFKKYGFDIDFDEDTTESEFKKKNAQLKKRANQPLLQNVREELLNSCSNEIKGFIRSLESSYNRKIKTISILPLHGKRMEVADISSAISFIRGYSALPDDNGLEYIEIIVRYNNESMIQCQFKEKQEVIEFLNRIK